MKGKGVLLERGHGPRPQGFEPGAVWKGITEYELNGIAVEAARTYLVQFGIPVDVTDSGLALHDIGKLAQGYDVFVSVHHNASVEHKAQGCEALYHAALGDSEDKRLAAMLAANMALALKFQNRGAKPANLAILSGAEKTDVGVCVLAECYFLDGPRKEDRRKMSRAAGQAIGSTILTWLVK
jgi:N-acetylmuramoyl-L-alanine amidase